MPSSGLGGNWFHRTPSRPSLTKARANPSSIKGDTDLHAGRTPASTGLPCVRAQTVVLTPTLVRSKELLHHDILATSQRGSKSHRKGPRLGIGCSRWDVGPLRKRAGTDPP